MSYQSTPPDTNALRQLDEYRELKHLYATFAALPPVAHEGHADAKAEYDAAVKNFLRAARLNGRQV